MWSEVQYLSRAHLTTLLARSVVAFAVACTVWAGGARADQGSVAAQPASAPEAQGDPCAGRQAEARHDCDTPRDGRFSGYSLGLDTGVYALDAAARKRAGVGLAGGVELRFGLAFWDQLVVSFGIGYMRLKDHQPFREDVVFCDMLVGVENCSERPQEAESKATGTFFDYEAGYQVRLRPAEKVSITPGVLVGYLHALRGLGREVDCEGCRRERLQVDAHGAAVTPFLRVTMGATGALALIARSRWFLTGDFQHHTTVGLECGMP